MQYGDVEIDAEKLEVYLGFDPANENVTEPEIPEYEVLGTSLHVPQREADILHLWQKVLKLLQRLIRPFITIILVEMSSFYDLA